MIALMLIPAAALWSVLVAWPLFELLRVSLTKTNYITSQFVGLANYARIFADGPFLRSVVNSLWYIALLVPMTVGGALAVAMTVRDLPKRWQDATRLVFYVPVIAAGLVIGQVWRWVYHIQGPLNWIVGLFGADPVSWMRRSLTAIPAVSTVVATSSAGGVVIVFLASILSIDPELYDAAKIDGAGRGQIARRIVLPAILPMVLSMSLVAAIGAPQIFETVYALGPFEHVATMGFAIYQEAFVMSRHGTAAAMSTVLLVAMFGLAYARQRIGR